MKRGYEPDTVMRKMLQKHWAWGSVRTDAQTRTLSEVLTLMMKYQVRANVTDRNIAVMAYLAKNPSALLVGDKNVVDAFDAGLRALEVWQKETGGYDYD